MDILGRGSRSVANLPHGTGKVGPDERRDRQVSNNNMYVVYSILGRRSRSVANLPHGTGEVGSDERRD